MPLGLCLTLRISILHREITCYHANRLNLEGPIVSGAESVAGWGGKGGGVMRRDGRCSSSSSQAGMAGIKFMPHEQGRAKSCYIL